jgi:hypothetical protein
MKMPELSGKLADLLSPCFAHGDAWIGVRMGKGRELWFYPLHDGKGAEKIADPAIVQAVRKVLPPAPGYGVNGRRVLPLAAKRGGVIRAASTLQWRTPYSWQKNFGA